MKYGREGAQGEGAAISECAVNKTVVQSLSVRRVSWDADEVDNVVLGGANDDGRRGDYESNEVRCLGGDGVS